jgi:O-antigen/teichoic acid export membrane protein
VKHFLEKGESRLQEEALDLAIKNKIFIEEQTRKSVDALTGDRLYSLLAPTSLLKRNTMWNLVGTCSPILLAALTIPYLIRQVGLEAFGILTLIWAIIGYFSLFDFGLGRALTQQVATKRASGLDEQLPSLVKTGLLLTLVTGMVGGALLAGTANQLGYKWLNVSVSLKEMTFHSLLIASLGIPLTTLTSGLRGVLEAHEDFKAVNLLRMLLGIGNFGLPVLSVMVFGPSLTMMVVSLVVARLVTFSGHMVLVHKITSNYFQAKLYGKKDIIDLLSFGGWMTVSNIISPLLVISDRFIISSMLGAGLVAYYTVPFEVLFRVLIIPMALTAALFPRLTSLFSTDLHAAKFLYRKSMKTVAIVMFPLCLFIAVGSYWGLKFWLGQDFAHYSWHIASILAVGVLFNGVAQIPVAALHATGRVRVTALIHLSELILYIPLLIVFLKYFGLLGAAMIWVIRVGYDLIILFIVTKKSMAQLC